MQGSPLIVWNSRGFFVPTRRAAWKSIYRNEKHCLSSWSPWFSVGWRFSWPVFPDGRFPNLPVLAADDLWHWLVPKPFTPSTTRMEPDVWAARLCAVSTQPACEFYQSVVAPFLWLEFADHHSLIVAETGKASLLSEETAGSRADAPMQVWQVDL
jgi:hypothetical protein